MENEIGRVIGCVALQYVDEDTGELRRMSVDANCRGQGIGRLLVEHLLKFGKNCGYKQICLWTRRDMEATKFYEKNGFKLVDTKVIDGTDNLLYRVKYLYRF